MTHAIQIKKDRHRSLHLKVNSSAGRRIATSASFDTIYRLEAGIAMLFQAASSAASVAVELDAGQARRVSAL